MKGRLAGSSCLYRMHTGASLVEFVVIAPVLLFMLLGTVQAGMVFHAKSNLNYAIYEAARAGTTGHANMNAIRTAFTNAMVGYYGGGRNQKEIDQATKRAQKDITASTAQIQILSPTKESFDDYHSPRQAKKHGVNTRVIPNSNISMKDNGAIGSASGQTLSDANILNLRVTYGIPTAKQIPLVGRFYVMALQGLQGLRNETSVLHGLNRDVKIDPSANQEAFQRDLLRQGRIPIVVHTTMRMQSDAFERDMVSNPGPGNGGTPDDNDPPDAGEPPADGGDGGPVTDPGTGGDDVSCNGSSQVPLYTPTNGSSGSSQGPLYTPVPGPTQPISSNQNASNLSRFVGEILKKG